jgi:hypothetical protein
VWWVSVFDCVCTHIWLFLTSHCHSHALNTIKLRHKPNVDLFCKKMMVVDDGGDDDDDDDDDDDGKKGKSEP